MSELQRLRDRVAELEALLGASEEDTVRLRALGLTKTSSLVLGIILKRPVASREAIYVAIYGARPDCDQPLIDTLDVYATRIRQILRGINVELKTAHNIGWYIKPEEKKIVRDYLGITE